MKTVKDSYYNRDNDNVLDLIHVVQVIFPIFSVLFFVVCFVYYQVSKKGSSELASEKDWSTTAAYYGVSFYFTLFVLCLDFAAAHYRRIGAEFILISNENLKNLVIAPIVFDSLAVVFIVALVFITGECICCRCCYMKGKKEEEREGKGKEKCCCKTIDEKCIKNCICCWCYNTEGGAEGGRKDNKCRYQCCKITDDNYVKVQYICLSLAGLAPLLCVASHAHFILIAWITNPGYASGIGIFYGIIVFVCFLTFKCVYYYVHLLLSSCLQQGPQPQQGKLRNCCAHFCRGDTTNEDCPNSLSCAALLLTLVIGLFLIGCFAMMACFFIYIPINNSIEDTPTQVYAIYQGIVVILTALLAYIVLVKPRSFSITKAVQKTLEDQKNKDGRKDISNEERLAEVLTKAVERYVSG